MNTTVKNMKYEKEKYHLLQQLIMQGKRVVEMSSTLWKSYQLHKL